MFNKALAVIGACMILAGGSAPVSACACCDTWKVVRVASNDVLNIRSGPGTRFAKVGAIPSGSGCVVKTGRCRGNWCRVSYIKQKGWVSTRYLEYIK